MQVSQIYQQTIKPLSTVDCFRLAVMILNDLAPHSVVDINATWTDEDYHDFSRTSWDNIDHQLEEDNCA